MRAPDGIPTDFEVVIAKWFIAAMITCFTVFLLQMDTEKKHCRDACRARDYPYYYYVPSGRVGVPPAQCYCRKSDDAPLREKQIRFQP